jgi:ubiquinone/menaquinone biosynthesis C-methylase UbiE
MRDHLRENTGTTDSGQKAPGGSEANRGIGFPHIYDLLLRILTRGREQQYRKDVLDLAGVAPGHRVLDIGCGTGTQAIAIDRRVRPGGSVIGVDISENMLTVARRKARRAGVGILFQDADAARLPFEDGLFDIVTITTVMHMVPPDRRQLCLDEVSRVLRRGGRLLIIDYAGDPRERNHWSAKHGRHRTFDLHGLHPAFVGCRAGQDRGRSTRLARSPLPPRHKEMTFEGGYLNRIHLRSILLRQLILSSPFARDLNGGTALTSQAWIVSRTKVTWRR